MALVVTTDGLRSFDASGSTLLAWLNSLTLHLFDNNHTVVVTDHLAALTEASFGGYASVATTGWTGPVLDGNNNDAYTLPAEVFTATGSGLPTTIYGAYFTDGAGKLVMAMNDPSPFTMSASGYTYTVSAAGTVAFGQLSGAP